MPGAWQTRRMVMVAVLRTGRGAGGKLGEGHVVYIMCSPCQGTGWIERDSSSGFASLTCPSCPSCYGTGIADMSYESLRLRHARG